MSDTERFAEMVDQAYDALHRLYHARGHICSQGCRAADWGSAKITLEAAGVPELLADLEEADAHVDARDAENERLHEEVGLLQPVLIAADLVVREWQLGHHPVPTMLVQAVYEVRQHDREAPAVPDDDRSEEVAGGS